MATLKDIEGTYDYLDELFRLSLGEHGDYTCAMFNEDFSKTLEEAQADKHTYILRGINFQQGNRVLDIGSGWGPMLKVVQDAGGHAVGLTLSPAQVAACQRHGLEAHLQDWKEFDARQRKFDGIVSVGAFEHFCSVEEFLAGKQDIIYQDFFKLCSDLLPRGGRLYLQTMLWGKKVPRYDDISLKARWGSDEWLLAHVVKFFPGSWLPPGTEQIQKDAQPYFKLVSENNGRLDYIETFKRWGEKFRKPNLKKVLPLLKLVLRLFYDRDFKYKLRLMCYGGVRKVFERELFTHQRMVFEKSQGLVQR